MISFPSSSFPRAPDAPLTTGSAAPPGTAQRMPSPSGELVPRRERSDASPPRSSVSPALYLDGLYGGLRPPRAKPGQSAVQWQEMAADGTAVVHPLRLVFALGPPSREDMQKMQEARQSVMAGRHYKWIIDSEGALVVGPAKVTPQEWAPAGSGRRRAEYLGHTTLIGGSAAPPGCIGGEWYRETSSDGKDRLIIDNNSGRYSEFPHLTPHHLDNIAGRFEQLGCPVECRWIDMLARREERRAHKAARAAAAAAAAAATDEPPP
jgi:hypothetical protein